MRNPYHDFQNGRIPLNEPEQCDALGILAMQQFMKGAVERVPLSRHFQRIELIVET
jgi:hypothetical protein